MMSNEEIAIRWISVLLCTIWLGLSGVPAQAFEPDADIERLWQRYQVLETHHLKRSGTGLDAERADQYRALFGQAAAIQAESEAGLRTLGPIERDQLQQILHQPLELLAAPASSPTGTATIQGQVLDTIGAAVTQGRLYLRPFGRWTVFPQQAVLDNAGNFVLANVPPGLYVLQVSDMPEHIAQAWPDLPCVNGLYCRPELGGEVIEILGGETVETPFTVERGVRVGGTVLDALGMPVEGATVRIQRRDGAAVPAVTDENGEFLSARGLPPGPFRVYINPVETGGELQLGALHDGQGCSDDCGRLPVAYLNLTDTSNPYMIDLQLQRGGRISGTVFDSDGVTPLAGARVFAQTADGLGSLSATTAGDGSYRIGPLRPTGYRLNANQAARLPQIYPSIDCFGFGCDPEVGQILIADAGVEITGIDFSLAEGSRVSGRVVRASDGSPVAGAFVGVGNSVQGGRSVQTDLNGEYEVEGLVEGTFFVTVRPGSANSELQRAHLGNVNCPATHCGDFGQPVRIPSAGQVSVPDIELSLGGGISGQTIDGLTGVPTETPFVSRLELWVADGPFAGQVAAQPFAQSDGFYFAEGLMPGAYKATFGTSSHLGLIDVALGGQPCPRGSCDLDALPTVFVTAGNVVSGIDAVYPRGPVISGRLVEAASGEPLPPQPPFGPNPLVGFSDVTGRYASFAQYDGDGFFRSRTGFPAGTFYVATFTGRNQVGLGANFIDQAYDGIDCPRLQCNLGAQATGLLIAGEDIENVDFNVRQGGRIRGSLVDAVDNTPLQGVGIEAYDSAGRLVALDRTNALGHYDIEALPSGSYTVRTRNLSGYFDELFGGVSCTPFCNPVAGTPVAVIEQSATDGVDFALQRSVALSGTVTLNATAAGTISVEVYNALGNLVSQALSGADGSYEVSGLAAGRYYLRTRNAFGHADVLYDGRACVGDACRVRQGDPVDLAGTALSGIDFDLSTGARISGRVLDRNDPTTSLSGVRVQLLDPLGMVAFETTSGADGGFQFKALAAGDYHLVTRGTPDYIDQTLGGTPCPAACNGLNGDVIQLAAGQHLTGQDLDLTTGATISGLVLASGTAAGGARAQVYDADAFPVAEAQANAAGQFEVDSLPDGQYFLRVGNVSGHVSELWSGIACSGYCDIVNGTPITIVDATSVTGLDFDLQPAGGLSGQVTRTGGMPAAGVQVLAFDNAGFLAGSAITNALGNFTIGGLVNGGYRVRTVNTAGLVDAVFGGSSCSPSPCDLAAGSLLMVSGGTLSGIDFSLQAGNSLSGTATDQFGNPLPGGTAVLFDQNGIEIVGVAISNGFWSFEGLANGTYFVLIRNTLGLVDRLYQDVDCPGGGCDIAALGTPITLPGGAGLAHVAPTGANRSTGLDLVLAPGDLISGTVVQAVDQQPLQGVTVFFYTQSGAFAGQAVTNALGEFESESGLPAGTYFAATAGRQLRGAGGNLINSLFDGTPCPLSCEVTAGTAIGVGGGAGADPGAVDFQLATGAGVRGRIIGPDSQDLVQIDVRLFDENGFLAGVARSDSLGHYRIEGLPAGIYYAQTANNIGLTDIAFGGQACVGGCAPTDGDPIQVPAGGMTVGIDFVLLRGDPLFGDRFE